MAKSEEMCQLQAPQWHVGECAAHPSHALLGLRLILPILVSIPAVESMVRSCQDDHQSTSKSAMCSRSPPHNFHLSHPFYAFPPFQNCFSDLPEPFQRHKSCGGSLQVRSQHLWDAISHRTAQPCTGLPRPKPSHMIRMRSLWTPKQAAVTCGKVKPGHFSHGPPP